MFGVARAAAGSTRLIVSASCCVLLAGSVAGCKGDAPDRPARDRLRVLIPGSYMDDIRALYSSGVRAFSIPFEEIEWVDMPGYTGRDAVFPPSLATRFADSEPDADVLFIDLYRIGSYRPAWLTPFGTGPFATVEKDFRTAFLDGARLADGSVYAIPWSAKGNFLYYRKDLVPEPPRTWKDLQRICERLPQEQALPRTMRYCLLLDWPSIQNDLYPALWSLSGGPTVRLDTEPVARLLSDIGAMMGSEITPGFVMMPRVEHLARIGSLHQRFARGEAVFMINWDNRYRFMVDELAGEGMVVPPTGIAPIPTAGTMTYSNIGTWGWIVPREPANASERSRKRHRAALQFVAEVSSKEAVDLLANRIGIIPARQDVPLPAELAGVLSPEVLAELEAAGSSRGFRFEDRGSDEFIHGYVRDAVKDVLICQVEVTKPWRSGLVGDCARYFDQCVAANDEETDCLAQAVRRRLELAQRSIDAHGSAGGGTR